MSKGKDFLYDDYQIQKIVYKFFKKSKKGNFIDEDQYEKYFKNGIFRKMHDLNHLFTFGEFVLAHKLQNNTLEEIATLYNLIGDEYPYGE